MSGVSEQTQQTSQGSQTPQEIQDIMAAIGRLSPIDLEKVAYHVSQLRMRKTTEPEAELLKTARRRRPRAFQRRYRELMEKRQEETLTEAEYQDLLHMTAEAEAFDTRRIRALSALADLRQTDLDTLMHELGLSRHG